MYTLIIENNDGSKIAYNDNLEGFNTNGLHIKGLDDSSWYFSDIRYLNLSNSTLNKNFISCFSPSYIQDCNIKTFVTNETSDIPVLENFQYRISAPLLVSASNVNHYSNYWNYSQLEYFIDSLPDWYGDWSTHEFSVYIQSYLQSTEKLAALIQKANDKGWTIYENY